MFPREFPTEAIRPEWPLLRLLLICVQAASASDQRRTLAGDQRISALGYFQKLVRSQSMPKSGHVPLLEVSMSPELRARFENHVERSLGSPTNRTKASATDHLAKPLLASLRT